MISVVVSAIHYPLTMARYFINAFKRREDVQLTTVGPFTGTWIPWGYGMNLDARYVLTPDIPLPREAINQRIPSHMLVRQIKDKPDIWIDIDAGWRVYGRPSLPDMVYVQVQTDPHVLKAQYNEAKIVNNYDLVYCMQTPYMTKGERYLPYAFDPAVHYPEDREKEYDVCLIGLGYDSRVSLLQKLSALGVKVRYGLGIVYDEYRAEYNKSRVALSVSSMQDLPARVWEAMGMKVPLVTNIVPDLDRFFVRGCHYLGFSYQEQAVSEIMRLLDNPDLAKNIADNAYETVKDEHTWDKRVALILKDCGYES